MKKFLFFSSLLILLFLQFATTHFEHNPDFPLLAIFLIKTFLFFTINIMVLFIFYFYAIKKINIKLQTKNILLIIFSIFLTLQIAEFSCMFYAQSHSIGYSLSHKKWMRYYWNNRQRDETVASKGFNKKAIFVLGDSFAAGAGIKRREDRFSNQLDLKLPENYKTINFGVNGAGTLLELSLLMRVKYKPDIVILQYYLNDIQEAALNHSLTAPKINEYPDLPKIIKPLFHYSYLLNFIYWQFPHVEDQEYLSYIDQTFSNSKILTEHLSHLRKMILLTKSKKAHFIAVIFPLLAKPEISKPYTDIIKLFFLKQGIPVIDVSSLVKDIPVEKRIVNKNDSHASKLVHKLLAEKLYDVLTLLGYVE